MDLNNLFDRVSTDVKTNFYPSVKTIFLSNREGGEKIVFVEGSDQVWSWFQDVRKIEKLFEGKAKVEILI
jgi:hypothetical protein